MATGREGVELGGREGREVVDGRGREGRVAGAPVIGLGLFRRWHSEPVSGELILILIVME